VDGRPRLRGGKSEGAGRGSPGSNRAAEGPVAKDRRDPGDRGGRDLVVAPSRPAKCLGDEPNRSCQQMQPNRPGECQAELKGYANEQDLVMVEQLRERDVAQSAFDELNRDVRHDLDHGKDRRNAQEAVRVLPLVRAAHHADPDRSDGEDAEDDRDGHGAGPVGVAGLAEDGLAMARLPDGHDVCQRVAGDDAGHGNTGEGNSRSSGLRSHVRPPGYPRRSAAARRPRFGRLHSPNVTVSKRAAALVLALVPLLASCPGGSEEIVIGVIGPLTGPLSFIGEQQRRGAEMARDEINESGGVRGSKIRLAIRDDADRGRLVGILRDLATRERAVALVGPEISTPLAGRSSPTARAGVPVLLPYGPLADTAKMPGVFVLTPTITAQAARLAAWLVEVRRISSIALASSGDDEGRLAGDALAKAIEAKGGRIAARRSFALGALDQTPLARQLQRSGAGALVVWGRPADAARVVIGANRIGWRPQIAGSIDLFLADYRSLAGVASDDTVIPLPFRRDFFTARVGGWLFTYLNRFGIQTIPKQRTLIPELPVLAMAAYDAVKIAAGAYDRAGGKQRGMIRAVETTKDFKGIGATYTFTATDREAIKTADLWTARFSNFAVVYDVDPRADREEQIAFYKIQVSALYIPQAVLESGKGAALSRSILEDVLTNPEKVEFYRPYRPPRPPPGPIR
jgi:branched-chain amino acid transport system substrate-binding protein